MAPSLLRDKIIIALRRGYYQLIQHKNQTDLGIFRSEHRVLNIPNRLFAASYNFP